MDHQVCLRWNNFHSSLAATLEYMWDEETLVDVTLFCEGQEIRAHKVVLSACSPAFKTLLKNNNCQHPIIILHNISLCDLEAILQFIYKGEVNIEQGQLNSLLRAAASLQIRGLSGIAEREKTVETAPTEEPPPKKVKKNNPKNSAASEHHEAPKKRTTRNSKENNEMHFITPKEEPLSEEESPVPEIPESDVEFALMEQLDAVSPLIKQPALPSEDSPTAESQSNPNQGIQMSTFTYNFLFLILLFFFTAFTCRNSQYPPYPCPFCCRAYTSWGFRRRHIKAMHTLSTHLPCKWCSAVLPSRDQWENHVVGEHNLSKSEAEQGLMVLEEAHMVLQTPNPTRLDALVDMVKQGQASDKE